MTLTQRHGRECMRVLDNVADLKTACIWARVFEHTQHAHALVVPLADLRERAKVWQLCVVAVRMLQHTSCGLSRGSALYA